MKRIFIPALMLGLTLASCNSNSASKNDSASQGNENQSSSQVADSNQTTDTSQTKVDDGKSSESVTTISSDDWDRTISDYDSFVDDYIKDLKKAKAGDMSVTAEYPALMEKAQTLSTKLQENQAQLSPTQMKRFIDIQTKMSKAAVDMMQK